MLLELNFTPYSVEYKLFLAMSLHMSSDDSLDPVNSIRLLLLLANLECTINGQADGPSANP